MRTIEDTLQAVYEIGRVAGAAETLKDEQTRDCIFGSAQAVYDGLLEEAIEEDKRREEVLNDFRQQAFTAPMIDWRPAPNDVLVQKAGAPTNFDRITADVKSLALFLSDLPNCGRKDRCPYSSNEVISTDDECFECTLKWLYEEAKV